MNKISVVIPYINTDSDFKELIYSVRSIYKHIKDYELVIIGDKPLFLNDSTYLHIPYDRVQDRYYPKCLDANNKMQVLLNDSRISENFIYTYDDIYKIKDVDSDILSIPYCIDTPKEFNTNRHTKLVIMTLKAISRLNNVSINDVSICETHTPRVINKAKMQAIFDKYKPTENRLLTNTLYVNEYFDNIISINKDNRVKVGMYGEDNDYSFNSECNISTIESYINQDTLFINHNDKGLSESLKQYIETVFNNKSIYEL